MGKKRWKTASVPVGTRVVLLLGIPLEKLAEPDKEKLRAAYPTEALVFEEMELPEWEAGGDAVSYEYYKHCGRCVNRVRDIVLLPPHETWGTGGHWTKLSNFAASTGYVHLTFDKDGTLCQYKGFRDEISPLNS